MQPAGDVATSLTTDHRHGDGENYARRQQLRSVGTGADQYLDFTRANRAASADRSFAWSEVTLVASASSRYLTMTASIIGVAAGVLRLVVSWVPVPEDNYLLPAPARVLLRFLQTLRAVPWEEGALMAIVWLEVLHPSRPWHTALLGAALIAYLLYIDMGGQPAAEFSAMVELLGGSVLPQLRDVTITADGTRD